MSLTATEVARAALDRSLGRSGPGAGRLPGLDLLRMAAVLAVIGFHYLFRGPVSGWVHEARFPELEGIAAYGYAGVDLFFVISGYVIAWSSEGRDPIGFARARFLRLWPAFVVCMTVTAIVLALAHNPTFPVGLGQWAANLVFLPQIARQGFVDGAYWSIICEITFYAWVFGLMAAGLWPRRILEIGALWLAVSLLNVFVLRQPALEFALLTNFSGEFLGGVLLYRLRVEGPDRAKLALLAASIAVATVVSVPYSTGLQRLYGFAADPVTVAAVHVAIFALVYAASVVRLDARAATVALAIGGMTYPAYLLHQNIGFVLIDLVVPAGIAPAAAVAVVTLLVLGVSYAVWRYVEPAGRRLVAPVLDRLLAALPGHLGGRVQAAH
jgi:peptidoglycan/LPS O-acetylase OafA/YrhL